MLDLKGCCLLQAPNLESRELWKGFLYSVIDVNIHLLHTCIPLPIRLSLLCRLVKIPLSCVITAECPVLPDAAAGPAPDAEGGGGQREVQEENPNPHTSSSLAPLCAFSGRDPTVSPPPMPAY